MRASGRSCTVGSSARTLGQPVVARAGHPLLAAPPREAHAWRDAWRDRRARRSPPPACCATPKSWPSCPSRCSARPRRAASSPSSPARCSRLTLSCCSPARTPRSRQRQSASPTAWPRCGGRETSGRQRHPGVTRQQRVPGCGGTHASDPVGPGPWTRRGHHRLPTARAGGGLWSVRRACISSTRRRSPSHGGAPSRRPA